MQFPNFAKCKNCKHRISLRALSGRYAHRGVTGDGKGNLCCAVGWRADRDTKVCGCIKPEKGSEINMTEEDRKYNVWAGNPKGVSEDKDKCIEEVSEKHSFQYYQCSRKRGFGYSGLYCKQHAKKCNGCSCHHSIPHHRKGTCTCGCESKEVD